MKIAHGYGRSSGSRQSDQAAMTIPHKKMFQAIALAGSVLFERKHLDNGSTACVTNPFEHLAL